MLQSAFLSCMDLRHFNFWPYSPQSLCSLFSIRCSLYLLSIILFLHGLLLTLTSPDRLLAILKLSYVTLVLQVKIYLLFLTQIFPVLISKICILYFLQQYLALRAESNSEFHHILVFPESCAQIFRYFQSMARERLILFGLCISVINAGEGIQTKL